MVRVSSMFSQVLREIPRWDFQEIVQEYNGEFGSKGFTCWDQLVGMLFCQLGRAESLREIQHGLAACEGKLKHLGIPKAPGRSTLSYANEHRPAEMYETLFYRMLNRFQGSGLNLRKAKFRFKNPLFSVDTTTITLCLSLFPWAKFRQAKGGVKLHVLLDHDVYMPRFLDLSEARDHDITHLDTMPIPAESVVAMDLGYTDYDLYDRWTKERIWFVTRMKCNAAYEVVEQRSVPKNRSILSDEVIHFTGPYAPKDLLLRRVVAWNEEKEEEVVLLTNHMTFGSTTISNIYKERWEIENFFKELKQTLKVKTFVGTSENAVRIQIWTALIALLLLRWLHFLSRAGLSFANLAGVLRLILFSYRDLFAWLQEPFDTPPLVPEFRQLSLL
jgi:hypothetical protein